MYDTVYQNTEHDSVMNVMKQTITKKKTKTK